MSSRKKFIQNISVASIALLANNFFSLANKFGYSLFEDKEEDVLFFEKSNRNYETYRKGFNTRIENYPKIIALCKTTKGVIKAIEKAKEQKLKISIKSGGHCMEGFSSNNGGLVINLSLMNNLDLIDKNIIKVGPAITLKQLYETLIPLGYYIPGGSCQSVAIGGLALGGGYGILSRAYGLTCDSLIEATMVTSDGSIISTKNDRELLWLLKGGGNGNFGVITEMKFKIYRAPQKLQSTRFRSKNISVSQAVDICKNWFQQTQTLPNSCFSAFIYNGKTTYILLTNTQTNSSTVNGFINYFRASSTNFSQTPRLPLGKALKTYYAEDHPIAFKNASAGLYKNFEDIENFLSIIFERIRKKPGILFQVNTLGGKIQDKNFEENSCFPYRAFSYFSELQAYWDSPNQAQKYLESFEDIQKIIKEGGINKHYRNYPDINFKEWDKNYYGNNLQKLKRAKQKYDKENLFAGTQVL